MSHTASTKPYTLMSRRFTSHWLRLLEEHGLVDEPPFVLRALREAYKEPHRRFHGLKHPVFMWDALVRLEKDAPDILPTRTDWAIVDFAIGMHDLFNDPGLRDNEARSATFAAQYALRIGFDTEAAGWVRAAVQATDHRALPSEPRAAVLCDLDLLSLAALKKDFDKNTRDLRQESRKYLTKAEFDAGVAAFFSQLLARKSIYATEYFRNRHEEKAQANLRLALKKFKK